MRILTSRIEIAAVCAACLIVWTGQPALAQSEPTEPESSVGVPAAAATTTGTTDPATGLAPGEAPVDKRILGVLTNYRTANMSAAATPISVKYKLTIAAKDSFDYPSYLLATLNSGIGQLNNANPSFGQGVKGYAHRYATGVADQVIGNMFTEGFMPAILHEDPRYFRMNTGSGWTRFRYAATRVLVTRTDSGHTRFNFSEVGGNAIGAAIGNAYYPDQRSFGDTMERMSTQIATDCISNILKEFWPDIKRKFLKKHSADATD